MPMQNNIGANDGVDIDSSLEIVSFEPGEVAAESDAEKSDAQLVGEGLIVMDTDAEMTVSPDSVYDPSKREEEKEAAEGGEPSEDDEKEKEEKVKEDVKAGKPDVDKDKGSVVDDKDKKSKDKKLPASAPDKIQLRINKITKEKFEALREKEQLAKERDELKSQLQILENSRKKADLENSKPILNNFETDAEYHEALGRWAAKMELHDNETLKEEKVKKAKETKTTEDAKIETSESVEDPRANVIKLGQELHEDFIEVAGSVPISNITGDIIITSEHAAEIFYHLGQNPELAKTIDKLSDPIQIAKHIFRIEAKYEVPEVTIHTPDQDSEFLESSNQSIIKKPLKTLEPVKPLSGGRKSGTDLEKADLADYNATRGYTRDGMKIRQ
uniref:Uncharacterized protein n=1 Tax=viral metagenome TaxID=1070528 RepID=A0A6H1ZXB3_9ZZZZ